MSKAYITYLCNDTFIPGAVALVKSGKFFEIEEPFVCMITEDVTEEGRKILLESGYSDLPVVDKIVPERTDGIKDRYKDNSWMMYTKLNLWSLTQYEKLAFLDADCLIVSPEMDMLDMPAVSAVKDIGYGGISAGVLVLDPNEDIYKDMLVEIINTEYDNTYSDQSFLDWYLKKNEMWNEIPIHYNALQKRIQLTHELKVYHYNGQKPWITDQSNSCHWQQGDNKEYIAWMHFYNLEENNEKT